MFYFYRHFKSTPFHTVYSSFISFHFSVSSCRFNGVRLLACLIVLHPKTQVQPVELKRSVFSQQLLCRSVEILHTHATLPACVIYSTKQTAKKTTSTFEEKDRTSPDRFTGAVVYFYTFEAVWRNLTSPRSKMKSITAASSIQGSAIGPASYIITAGDMNAVNPRQSAIEVCR